MSRLRFESLERRQMFAATSLADAATIYVLLDCPNDFMARPEEVIPAEAVAFQVAGSGPGGSGVGEGLGHDAEFEDWAHVARFDRGYLPPV